MTGLHLMETAVTTVKLIGREASVMACLLALDVPLSCGAAADAPVPPPVPGACAGPAETPAETGLPEAGALSACFHLTSASLRFNAVLTGLAHVSHAANRNDRV
jgi:hypothetical protein